ncbi:MAG: hypothetical protein Q9M31_08505 [Mariprofundus sp.]|nr:hypothetical protein [Mariprofundus sp.]
MKKIHGALLGATMLLSAPAMAANFNITNLSTSLPGQTTFDALANDLSAAIWMNPSNSAEPHSAGFIPVGFQVGVEATSMSIDQNAWSNLGVSTGSIVVPKLRVSAGIPFGLDFSLMYTAIPSSNIKVTGYEGRMAFGEMIPLPFIEFNIRAYQSKMTGVPELSIKDSGFAAMLGADFPIIKPYVEVGQVKSTATPSGLSAVAFKEFSKTSTTAAVGVKLTFIPFVIINAEYAKVDKKSLYTFKFAGEF